jgi:hypothetical protein
VVVGFARGSRCREVPPRGGSPLPGGVPLRGGHSMAVGFARLSRWREVPLHGGGRYREVPLRRGVAGARFRVARIPARPATPCGDVLARAAPSSRACCAPGAPARRGLLFRPTCSRGAAPRRRFRRGDCFRGRCRCNRELVQPRHQPRLATCRRVAMHDALIRSFIQGAHRGAHKFGRIAGRRGDGVSRILYIGAD